MILQEILEPLIDRAEVAGERAVLLATEGEEVIDERREPIRGCRGRHARQAEFAQLQVQIRDQLRVGFARVSSVGGGGRSELAHEGCERFLRRNRTNKATATTIGNGEPSRTLVARGFGCGGGAVSSIQP